MLSLRVQLACLGLFFLLSACPVAIDPGASSESPQCVSTENCPGQQVCLKNKCVELVPGFPSKKVWVFVSLDADTFTKAASGERRGARYQTQQLKVDLQNIHRSQIIMKQSLEFDGIAQKVTKNQKTPLEAKIFITTTRQIEGKTIPTLPIVRSFHTDTLGRFKVLIPVGDYDITIIPKDSSLPIAEAKGVSLSQELIDTAPQQTLPFLYHMQQVVYFRGQLTISELTNQEVPKDWLKGLQVRFLEESGKVISNTATVDIDGKFQISTYGPETSGTDSTIATLQILERKGERYHPRVNIPVSSLFQESYTLDGTKFTQIGIQKGGQGSPLAIPAVSYKKLVKTEVDVLSGNVGTGSSITNATIFFQKKQVIGFHNKTPYEGFYQVKTKTNRSNIHELSIPEGSYDVIVIPPANSNWATANYQDIPVEDSGRITLQVHEKYQLSLALCAEGAEQCELKAQKIIARKQSTLSEKEPLSEILEVGRLIEQESSFSASYLFFLEPGFYDFFIFPPPGKDFVFKHFQRVEISQKTISNLTSGGYLTQFIEKGNLLYSRLVGSNAQVIPNALVEFYEQKEGSKTKPLLLGRSLADEQGVFSIHLKSQ